MQFTPQQLAGGPKYSSCTRIGNWQEEVALEETRSQVFLKKQSQNQSGKTTQLLHHQLRGKIDHCLKSIQLTKVDYSDNLIRYGDEIILYQPTSSSILTCDPYEKTTIGIIDDCSLATTTSILPQHQQLPNHGTPINCDGSKTQIYPVSRNTFRIVRPPSHLQDLQDLQYTDDVLKIGQPFLLACHDSLLESITANTSNNSQTILSPPLYLSSIKKTDSTATKRSNKQSVYLSKEVNSNAVWTFTTTHNLKNENEFYLSKGKPVESSTDSLSNNLLVLTHRSTNNLLTCSSLDYHTLTEFGVEYEVYCDRNLMSNTHINNSNPAIANFYWKVLAAPISSSASSSPVNKNVLRVDDPYSASEALNLCIKSRGIDAFWNLRKYLYDLEDEILKTSFLSNKNKTSSVGIKIEKNEFFSAILNWGLDINKEIIKKTLDLADSSNIGLIDLRNFMDLVTGYYYLKKDNSNQFDSSILGRSMNIRTINKDSLSIIENKKNTLGSRYDTLAFIFRKLLSVTPSSTYTTIDQINKHFNADDHPLVAIGGYSRDAALDQMLYFMFRYHHVNYNLLKEESKRNKAKEDELSSFKLSFDSFVEYYMDFSAAIDDDDYFKGVVNSNWR